MTRVAPTGDMRCANDYGSPHVTPLPGSDNKFRETQKMWVATASWLPI